MDTAAPLLAAAQVAADWHPGRACSITEHLTERSPTAILTQLKTAVTRRRRELEAEALVLHPDLPDPADTRPTGALLVADGTERQS
ncbi:hypothetical protein [Streptomyces sp. RKAG293]|nr:hypothetical protein [Streptomyces sp. RKAG293]MCM2424225.1 hypothetical protein [Streptomyces sp. RKAG293]